MSTSQLIKSQHHYQQNIKAEMIYLLYGQAKPAIGGTLVVATCLVYALYGVIATHVLFGWYALMVVVSASRYFLVELYARVKPEPEKAQPGKNILLFWQPLRVLAGRWRVCC